MSDKTKNDNKGCSLFEEMLMWTSYRYAIGRKSYVSCLASDLPKHYYHRLTPERRQFTAGDIRNEIYHHMGFLPFDLTIRRTYNTDVLNPINVVLEFIRKENITSFDELVKYKKIEYDAHTDEYKFIKCDPTIDNYFSIHDIDDYIIWESFASSFDDKNHRFLNGKEMFRTWQRKHIPVEGKPGYVMNAPFGWEPIWCDLESFLTRGEYCGYLPEDEFLKRIENENKAKDNE